MAAIRISSVPRSRKSARVLRLSLAGAVVFALKETRLRLKLLSIEVDQIAASLPSEGALSIQPRLAPAGNTDLGGNDVGSSLNNCRTRREHNGGRGPA